MFHYNPLDPSEAMYAQYTATTTVPTITLQQTLQSLAIQQSRLYEQRQQLAAEEQRIRRLRAATLKRMRAQRYREALEEYELEEIVEQILGRDRDEERALRDTVMEILNDTGARRMEYGLPPSQREFQREIRVREMLDPTPRTNYPVHRQSGRHHRGHPYHQHHVPQIPTFHFHVEPPHESTEDIVDTPVVDELPPQSPVNPPQYVPEGPTLANKRGSRRNSVRRESFIRPDPPIISVSTTQAFESFANLRQKLTDQLQTIPQTIRSDTPPTQEEEKLLQLQIAKLEGLLDEVDAVVLPTEPTEDVTNIRLERRTIVAQIVHAISEIERHLQPGTPTEGTVEEGTEEDEDSEDNELINAEIQRVIRETLARKKDENVPSRRSVTIEDVPDSEY